MAETCERQRANPDLCAVHPGGTFSPPRWRLCSKNPNPFHQAGQAAEEAFRKQLQQLDAEVQKFDGWNFVGYGENGWEARGPAGRRTSVKVTAPTPHGLLERIRQATSPFHREPAQGSLL